jgi:hypothetical protein
MNVCYLTCLSMLLELYIADIASMDQSMDISFSYLKQ